MAKKYARGGNAWGECGRSGRKMLLKDMVFDGQFPNMRVDPDWYEPKHPQERLVKVDDPVALYRPAPELLNPPTPPILSGLIVAGQGRLNWIPAESDVSQIDHYELWRARTSQNFSLLATIPVTRDMFGGITSLPTYLDTTTNFAVDYYLYYLIAFAVEGGTSQSNTLPLATPPVPVVLTGNYIIPNIDLTWTQSSSDSNTVQNYLLYRSKDGAAYQLIDTVPANDTREFLDTNVFRSSFGYTYKVVVQDAIGVLSADSNIVSFPRLRAFFVAAGNISTTQMIATSPDGIAWTLRTTPTSPTLIGGICFSPELGRLVAVGSNGALSSDDGITWTTRTMPLVQWNDVAWSPTLHLFCAVSDGATGNGVATSPDGITWTLRATPNRLWNCVRWFGKAGLFVSGAITGGLFGDTQRIMTSPDGITWTSRTTPTTGGGAVVLYRMDVSPLRVSCSSRQNFGQTYSDDGINWSFNSDGLGGSAWLNICYGSGPNLWVAAGSGSNMVKSPNGGTLWTGANATKSVEGLAYSADLNMYVGGNTSTAGTRMSYSFNGNDWTLATTPTGMNSNNFNNVCAAVLPI